MYFYIFNYYLEDGLSLIWQLYDLLHTQHLLGLIQEWGDSAPERAQRLSIYSELNEGNVDTERI